MSDQDSPAGRWVVRKSDGTELRFPSLDALKGYILSGVITQGDVVAPEDATWARVEDLAELASLMGMMKPPSEAATKIKRPATRPNLNFGSELDVEDEPTEDETSTPNDDDDEVVGPPTNPPPLPDNELDFEIDDEPSTVYSGPPAFEADRTVGAAEPETDPLSRPMSTPEPMDDSPLSRPLHTTSADEDALLSRPADAPSDDDPLSRPLSHSRGHQETDEVMALQLRRAQRHKVIVSSIVIGMLIAVAAFFAVESLQKASAPPDQQTSTEETKKAEGAEAAKDDTATNEKVADDKAEPPPTTSPTPTPSDQKPADKKSADDKPADDKSADKKPADDKSAGKKPADDKSTDKKPADKKPADKKPAGKKPADKSAQPPDPAHVDGLMARARKVRKKDPAEALRLYKIALKKNPNNGDAIQLAARACLQLGKTQEAITLLKACRSKLPRFSPCIYYLGRAFERAGKKGDAEKAYQKLIDQFPESSLASKARKKLND